MRARAALALLAGLLALPAGAQSPWQLELAGQQDWQSLRETAADGRRLVAEDGRLDGVAATLRWAPLGGAASAALRLGVLRGVRDYQGLSNQGQAIATRSDVTHRVVRAEGALAARALTGHWQWQPLAAAEFWQWRRHLRDAGPAAGYPERYRQGLLLLGLQAQNDAGWLARLEAGGGPGGHNRVQLPGRDATTLPLGSARVWRATLGAAITPAWKAELAAEHLRLGAGEERAITLQGVPLQSARQPRTELRRLQLQLGWAY